MRTILLNIAYLCLLVLVTANYAVTFWRDPRRLEGFWPMFWGRPPTGLDDRPVVWFHASSVGESLVVCPVLRLLQAVRPDLNFVLSVMTHDGLAVAKQALPQIRVFYVPFDFSWAVSRVYRALCPCCLFVCESDLWPHMLAEARRRKTPMAVFNTRLSDREVREYRWLGSLLQPAIRDVVWWGTQTQVDAERVRSVFGLTTTAVEVTGSIKFDGLETDRGNAGTQRLRHWFGFRSDERILVAGSTHEPEEEWASDALLELRAEFPSLRLVIVPRNAHRFGRVAAMVARKRIHFVRRSRLKKPLEESTPITLVDSVGELRWTWGLADMAFVGGSLVRHGGQNFLEPCAYGVPTCFGPNVWNFADAAKDLVAAGGAVQLADRHEFLTTIRRWLTSPDLAKRIGERAQTFVAGQRGAAQTTADALMQLLPPERRGEFEFEQDYADIGAEHSDALRQHNAQC